MIDIKVIIFGLILDYIFNDPNVWYHPICLIGRMISFFENKLRKITSNNEKSLLISGGILWIIVCSISYIVPYFILKLDFTLLEVLSVWLIVSAGTLKKESLNVKKALEEDGIEAGRKAVARIVGRDTKELTSNKIINATIETIAENTTDGIIAPLFYIFIGGIPLGFMYKAINTLDSMVGYKNDKYLYFGKVSAKIDDLFNYIPARITAIFMIISVFLLKYDYKNAVVIFKRDRFNHSSPNAGQTESVVAGALGLKLCGSTYYFGEFYEKDFIGDEFKFSELVDIDKANNIMYLSVILFTIFGCILTIIVGFILGN